VVRLLRCCVVGPQHERVAGLASGVVVDMTGIEPTGGTEDEQQFGAVRYAYAERVLAFCGRRLNVATQFTSQVLPPSVEKACSHRGCAVSTSDHT